MPQLIQEVTGCLTCMRFNWPCGYLMWVMSTYMTRAGRAGALSDDFTCSATLLLTLDSLSLRHALDCELPY